MLLYQRTDCKLNLVALDLHLEGLQIFVLFIGARALKEVKIAAMLLVSALDTFFKEVLFYCIDVLDWGHGVAQTSVQDHLTALDRDFAASLLEAVERDGPAVSVFNELDPVYFFAGSGVRVQVEAA